MGSRLKSLGLVAVGLAVVQAAPAGLLDSAPPGFSGAPGMVVYRLGPVYFQPGKVNTTVTCNNIDNGPVQVAIEIFDGGDQLTGDVTRVSLDVGGVVTFVTSAVSSTIGQVVIGKLPAVDHGKARISATSPNISCTAFHRVPRADGTTDSQEVSLIKKVAPSTRP